MSINRGMDKEDVTHICNGILLTHEKNKIMPLAATWVSLEIMILNEVRKRKADPKWHHLHVASKT